MSDDLPMGWDRCDLGTVISVKNGYAFKSSDYSTEGIPLARISDIQEGKVNLKNSVFIPKEKANLDFIVQNGDLLIAMSGATTGKVGIYTGEEICLQNQRVGNFKILSPQLLNTRFRDFYVLSLGKNIEDASYGGAQPNISSSVLESFEIPLPPLNEQRRIVDKLERICDRNRTARNELSHIPKLIARYKQAVLAAAFRGDLTADWREKHGKMRTQWQNVSLDNLISCYQNGLSKRSGNDGQEIIVVRLADIKDFKVCLSDPRKIKLTEKEEEKYNLQAGDILVVRVNGSKDIVGRLVLITQDLKAAYCDHFIRLRLTSECNPYWLSYYGNSDEFRKYISENMVSSAGQNTVSQGTLKDYLVEIPSLEEQKEIVRRVEKIFEKIDLMEEEYQKAAKLCDRLEQATLAKAFRGELVPQDPDDEPASVLLEQVKREKHVQPKGKSVKSK
ncbi:MAG: restriction endonuclease subunit S [Pseudanabaena sp.]